MINKQLLAILACPKCKGDLEYREKDNLLICHHCRLKYLISKEGIPNMIIEEAESF